MSDAVIITLVIVILLIVLGFGVYYVLEKKKQNQPSTTPVKNIHDKLKDNGLYYINYAGLALTVDETSNKIVLQPQLPRPIGFHLAWRIKSLNEYYPEKAKQGFFTAKIIHEKTGKYLDALEHEPYDVVLNPFENNDSQTWEMVMDTSSIPAINLGAVTMMQVSSQRGLSLIDLKATTHSKDQVWSSITFIPH